MSGPRIRTLLVDDDPAVLRLHSAYLRDVEGFELVAAVRTGTEGARMAADTSIDLVLLDMNLPDFSGIEVLHRLRLVREWGVDVMVISSARDGFTVRQALAAHVVGYLVKPFTKEAFVARLTEYRDERGARPAETPIGLAQGEIDRLVEPRAAAAPSVPTALPKGLADSTLQTILAALHPTTPATVQAIADASGASRATVRRYLAYLTDTGRAAVSHRFGARGRPEVLYRRVA
ncbi:response regulator of citrate/malate metabolism [Microbacterium sp. AG1240]|uniref:response regulator n=1 Tax=Microbacterium sp. AG1240 TaxID=2183992 RepID=UPI000EB43B2D|nr:response regulator [Microbacterium sp. AG1240]RKT31248.1 response regulator of citrate/malate metabolism [Microbacterium sp. AG1240]